MNRITYNEFIKHVLNLGYSVVVKNDTIKITDGVVDMIKISTKFSHQINSTSDRLNRLEEDEKSSLMNLVFTLANTSIKDRGYVGDLKVNLSDELRRKYKLILSHKGVVKCKLVLVEEDIKFISLDDEMYYEKYKSEFTDKDIQLLPPLIKSFITTGVVSRIPINDKPSVDLGEPIYNWEGQ